MTTFGSVCSGIEAASVAWEPLGWRALWYAEIEAFPSAVLAYRHPWVPNLGDMRMLAAQVRAGEIEAPDVLVGGTPCQAFSVAGLRAGLADPRGALVLHFLELADAIDAARSVRGLPPCVIVWENVPGVLSTRDNAFGAFLGGLAGEGCALEPPGRTGRRRSWSNAGAVFGPVRTVAWRLLDAQYFRVAQRRRRCFVVSSARAGFDPTAVLFDFEGVRRDSAPRRDAGQNVTGTLSARTSAGGGLGTDFELGGGLQPVVQPVVGTIDASRGGADDNDAKDGRLVVCLAHGQGGAEVASDRSPTLTCLHEAPIACYAFQPRVGRNGRGDMGEVVNALTAQAGETGKGDAAPCVALQFGPDPEPCAAVPLLEVGKRTGPSSNADPRAGAGVGAEGDPMFTLQAGAQHGVAVAFKASHFTRGKDGAPSDVVPPLSADADKGDQDTLVCAPSVLAFDSRQDPVSSPHTAGALGSSSPQAQAVCFVHDAAFLHCNKGRPDGRKSSHVEIVTVEEVVPTLTTDGLQSSAVVHRMAVRRLTPRECERLQGFPDDYTLVPYGRAIRPEKLDEDWIRYLMRGGQMTREECARAAADGPRYKALGNTMAVPCMAFLGRRINAQLAQGGVMADERFEAWWEDWHDPHVGMVENRVEKIAARAAWRAAQESQAADRTNADHAFALGIALERCMVAAGIQYGTTRSVGNLLAGAGALLEWIERRAAADVRNSWGGW